MKHIYTIYGNAKKKNLTDEVVIEIIKKETGRDLTYFWDEYVNGRKKLDMDYLFKDDDKDGVCNGARILMKGLK